MNQKFKCVLLVDDDDATNFLNKIFIENSGIAEHIQVAWNGEEALEYITNTGMYENKNANFPKPDLIFLDINMPVMDGWEFMQEYHKLDEKQKENIVIIMLTTSTNPDDKTKAASFSEISDFRSKPLLAETLEEIERKYFPENFS